MATVSRGLPEKPHIDVPKREARALLKEWWAGSAEALERIGRRHPGFQKAGPAAISAGKFLLNDAQLVIAREYGFSNWAELKERINANTVAGLLQEAIHKDDRETVVRLLRTNRSEEHTSELQSRLHLVCRLLLEKKKKKRNNSHAKTHN